MFNMFKHEDSVIFDPIWCSVIGSDISKSTGAPKKRFLEEYERDLCYRRCAKKLIDEDLIYGVTNANYAKRADAMKITAVIYQLMYGDKEADYAKLLSLFGKEYASTADVVSGLYRRMADPTAKLPFKYIKDTWGSDLGNVAVFAIYLLASPESYLPQNRKSFERLSEVFSQINSTRKNTSPMSDQQKVLMKYGISIQKNFSDFETAAMQGSLTRTIPVENEDGTCTQDTIFSYSDYGVHCHSELLSGLAMLDAGVSNCSNYDKTITKQKFLDAQKAVAKSLNFTKEMDGKVKFGDNLLTLMNLEQVYARNYFVPTNTLGVELLSRTVTLTRDDLNKMIEMWLSEMTNTHTCVDAREYTEAYIDDDSEKTLIFPIIELEELVYQKAGREKYHIVCERGTQDGISRTMGNKVIDFKDMNNEPMPAHKYDDAGIRRDGINPLTHSGYWEEEP